MDRSICVTKLQDDFRSPDIDSSRHTGDEGCEAVRDGLPYCMFKAGYNDRLRNMQLFRSMTGETTAMKTKIRLLKHSIHLAFITIL